MMTKWWPRYLYSIKLKYKIYFISRSWNAISICYNTNCFLRNNWSRRGGGAIQVREFISFHMLAKPPLRSEREDAYPKNKMVIFLCLMHCELVHGENLSRLIINLNYPGRRVGGFYLSIYNKAQFISYITGCWCPYFISFTFYQHNNSVKHVETS